MTPCPERPSKVSKPSRTSAGVAGSISIIGPKRLGAILAVARVAFAPASFLLQLLDLFRSLRFGPILIEFLPSFAAERLEIRALRAGHRLVFCYPLVGIFLRIECCRWYIWRNVVVFHQGRFVSARTAGLAENSQSALRAMSWRRLPILESVIYAISAVTRRYSASYRGRMRSAENCSSARLRLPSPSSRARSGDSISVSKPAAAAVTSPSGYRG